MTFKFQLNLHRTNNYEVFCVFDVAMFALVYVTMLFMPNGFCLHVCCLCRIVYVYRED